MTEKILITGVSGFVARHFISFLNENRINAEIIGLDIIEPKFDFRLNSRVKLSYKKVNLLETQKLRETIVGFNPNYIVHLAAFSSVAYSWKNPIDCFKNNTNIFLNLVSVVKDSNIDCRILAVGSSEEYGKVETKDIPLKECNKLAPLSPYAIARILQEMLSKLFVQSFGMDIVLTRSFNHIGIWQDERFVVPSFIKKLLSV